MVPQRQSWNNAACEHESDVIFKCLVQCMPWVIYSKIPDSTTFLVCNTMATKQRRRGTNARLTSNEGKKSTIRNDKRCSRLKNKITIHVAADKILMANTLLIDRHRFVIGRPRVRPRMPRWLMAAALHQSRRRSGPISRCRGTWDVSNVHAHSTNENMLTRGRNYNHSIAANGVIMSFVIL